MENSIPEMHSGQVHHHKMAAQLPPAHIAIVTVSDSRTHETDVNGLYLRQQIDLNHLILTAYHLVHDESLEIKNVLETLSHTDANVILFNGGTGISHRDTTFDIVSAYFEKSISGFGEIFRMLSYQQIGAGAMLSRAAAGIYREKIIFLTPGSPAAVKLAWEKLILPELQHFIWEISR